MAVIRKFGHKQDNFLTETASFFSRDPHQASSMGVADRQTGGSSLRIRDTHSTHSTWVREQIRNIQCLPRNQSLNESGESQTDRIVRDRSESVKIPVSQRCRNSPVSASWGTCKTFLSELESNYKGSLDPSVDQRDRTSPIIKSLSEKNSGSIEIQNRGTGFDRFRNREFSVKNAARETTPTSDSFYSNVFLVPKKGGELRPVINLKNLNSFLPYEHFEMEGVHLLKDLMEEGDWLVKLDLKDAYLTINVAEEFRKYLKFFWRNKIMEFTSLPFGIAIAPRVFTKIMKIPIAILRCLGIRLVIYLDNILIMNQSLTGIQSDLSTAVYLLENLGFLINQEKSVLVPSHVTEFLGFTVNSQTMTLSLPKEKVIKIKQNCLDLVSRQSVSARDLAQLIGRLTATNQAVLPSPLHYRSLQLLKTKALHTGGNYDHHVQLDEDSKQELIWWSSKLSKWNGRALVHPQPNIVVKSDASLIGWGAICQNTKTGGLWMENERDQHINEFELKAAFLAMQCFQSKILKKHVLLQSDNKVANNIT